VGYNEPSVRRDDHDGLVAAVAVTWMYNQRKPVEDFHDKSSFILSRRSVPVKAIIAIIFSVTISAQAGNWYVRPAFTGTHNGTSWTTAWSDVTGISWSSVAAGDTVWLASGSYSSLTPSKSGTSGNPIAIRRVLSSDSVPVAASGWSSGYDGLVTMGTVNFNSAPNYISLDGRVEYGIKVNVGDGGQGLVISTTSAGISVKYVEVSGPPTFTTETDLVFYDAPSGTITSPLISHCYIHGTDTLIERFNTVGMVVEYTKLFDSLWNGVDHPDVVYSYPCSGSIFRYNTISNIYSEGAFYTYGGSTGEYWYGNVFEHFDGHPFWIRDTSDIGSGTYGTFFLYNNTFANAVQSSGDSAIFIDAHAVSGIISSSSRAYNNIFYNAHDGNTWGPMVPDYNYYIGTSSDGAAHSATSAVNPFVNQPTDFHLSPGSGPINKGVALTADGFINMDMDGDTRGADGTWDIGAYEFTATSTNPPIVAPSPPTLLRILQ
jgi:hypothetical protein